MVHKLLDSAANLSIRDLLNLKKELDLLIKRKYQDALGRRRYVRAKVNISGSAEIEREKNITDRIHKITILNMSVNGLCFTTKTVIFETDILGITFRLPSTGAMKRRDCQAVRVREILERSGTMYEVGAQAVSREVIRNYKATLHNQAL